MDKKIVLSWLGLRNGPVIQSYEDYQNNIFEMKKVWSGDVAKILGKFSISKDSPTNDPEYFALFTEFFTRFPQGSLEPKAFGQEFQKFAEEKGYEVVVNSYLGESKKLNEAMSSEEAEEFIRRLKAGEVMFKFNKVDGTLRRCNGTLKADLIPGRQPSDGVDGERKRRTIPDSIIVYYDLDKQAFRSFRKDNFAGYIE